MMAPSISQRVGHNDLRKLDLEWMLNQQRACSARSGFLSVLVTVEALTAQGGKERTGFECPAVDRDDGEGAIFADKTASTGTGEARERRRDQRIGSHPRAGRKYRSSAEITVRWLA
jgi:hypothetical protein